MPKLKEGDTCLLNVLKYSGEWAKVIDVEMDTALIHWYGGSKTSGLTVLKCSGILPQVAKLTEFEMDTALIHWHYCGNTAI